MSSHVELKPNLLRGQQAVNLLRSGGRVGFWVQLVLTALSGLILIFAILDPSLNLNLSSGISLLSVIGGMSALSFSVYWFFRYSKLARQLQDANPDLRPTLKETVRGLQLGVLVNLAAMVLTLVGVETIVGALLLKTLSIPLGAAVYRTGQLIEPIDIFVVQANIGMVVAQFVGITIPLWLASRIENH
jgi:hypothetical protein